MAHWTKHLPEFGRHYRVTTIERRNDSIAELRRQIEIMEREIKEEEDILMEEIKKEWSQDEIEQAKKDAITGTLRYGYI